LLWSVDLIRKLPSTEFLSN